MTIFEIRMLAVLGLLAIGALALFASFAVVHLQGLVQHRNDGAVRAPVLPLARTHAPDVARLANRRPAA